MSVGHQAFKAGMWLALFQGASQIFSWISTLVVARLLVPTDYGLMEMATLLTGYVLIFHEMGLGAAIVQRDEVSDAGLSSVFWLTTAWGALLAGLCFVLAYPTVAIFNEPRVLNVTRAVSVLFLLGPVMVVPRNLLHRELRFKALGFAMALSVTISCIAMIAMAWMGAGVWTLLGGHIVREFVQLVLFFWFAGWRPKPYCSLHEAMPYLKFGLPVVGARSIDYIISKTDIFFGGRNLSTVALGQYSFALRLAEIPNFKMLSIVNSVSYSALSKLKHDKAAFHKFYLRIVKLVGLLVMPLYVGGIYVAEELIPLVLGAKWQPAVVPFQIVCVGQLVVSLSFANSTINMAQGRPRLDFLFRLFSLPFFIGGFYISASFGTIGHLALPWATVVPVAHVMFTVITLRFLDLPVSRLIRSLASPFFGTVIMVAVLYLFDLFSFHWNPGGGAMLLIIRIGIGAAAYAAYVGWFEREMLAFLFRQFRLAPE